MQASALSNAWLRPAPDADPDRQVLVGDPFEVAERQRGWVFGRALKDGYGGWVPEAALGEAILPSHWVSARSTWGYAAPDIKSTPMVALHMSARLEAAAEQGDWLEAKHGELPIYVPLSHVRPWAARVTDLIASARQFLGAPYLWAGNTGFGLDCSGLVQVVYHAAGLACAADSQDQAAMPGDVPEDQRAGDLIFWKDHVAIETGDGTLIHANAHHMAVTEEPRHVVISRNAATETGPVTARLRPERRGLE